MKTFIPRDAGFFSVFNFLIGAIHAGEKIYPYYNREHFLKANRVNEHFCYWSNSENTWLDFFLPISYDFNDENHLNIDLLKTLSISQGNEAGFEFRIPKETYRLVTDPTRWYLWRQDVNNTYKTYIKFNQSLLDKAKLNSYDTTEHIGVHYRHPSHFTESGQVYLQQYFDEINKIDAVSPTKKSIFLASDNEFGVAAFKKKYGTRLFYLDYVDRVDFDGFLEWSFALGKNKADGVGFIGGKGYELHHKQAQNIDLNKTKKMTEDLLIEVLSLSKCQYLVHTLSNISTAISYMNPNIEMKMIEGTF